jgi:hypothetical protein
VNEPGFLQDGQSV